MIDTLSQQSSIKSIDVSRLCEELRQRLIDETQSKVFFSIEPSKQDLLDENQFGDSVAEAFPSATEDINHAAQCLALDQWTASVFHSMRVLGIGLNALARNLGVTDEENWKTIIDKIEKEIRMIDEAFPKEKRKTIGKFNAEAALQFHYFKNAWRNHVMHVRDTYDEQRAESIFRHVKDFMVHLATELKEERA
jgi:hypothetical protein